MFEGWEWKKKIKAIYGKHASIDFIILDFYVPNDRKTIDFKITCKNIDLLGVIGRNTKDWLWFISWKYEVWVMRNLHLEE